jgi:hypothetical protein
MADLFLRCGNTDSDDEEEGRRKQKETDVGSDGVADDGGIRQ